MIIAPHSFLESGFVQGRSAACGSFRDGAAARTAPSRRATWSIRTSTARLRLRLDAFAARMSAGTPREKSLAALAIRRMLALQPLS